eukprot:4162817-Amphidinium_carterae.1
MQSLRGISKAFLDWVQLRGSVTGITLLHHVHDGGLTLKYRCAISEIMEGLVMVDVRKLKQGVLPEQSCVCLHVTCVLHALHNSLHWSLQSSLYLAVFKGSMSLMFDAVGGWLVQTLCPVPIRSGLPVRFCVLAAAGREKLGAHELLVSIVLGVASYLPAALMADLLKDSRCVQLQGLECVWQEEILHIEHLTSGFW